MPARHAQRGIALITVLWGLLILSLIAAALLSTSRVSSVIAHDSGIRARAEAAADAAINRAVLGITDRRFEQRWRVDGVPTPFEFDGIRFMVTIQDEYGLIDLNAAGDDLLRPLLRSAGLDGDTADTLADRIEDWRDPSPLRRLKGAKDADYATAGFPYGPRNGPFSQIDELKMVMGVTPEIYRRIAPALTVYSGRPAVNPQTAPLEVLQVLPGYDQSKAAASIAARGTAGGALSGPIQSGKIDPAISTEGWPFTIEALVVASGPVGFRCRTNLRLTANAATPIWILAKITEPSGK